MLLTSRVSAVKLAFNTANFAVIAVVDLAVFHAFAVPSGPPGPTDWLAAFAATLSASVVCVFAIATAISLSGGAPQFQKLPGDGPVRGMVALANTSLALLAVTVMWIEPSAVWLLVVPLVTMFLAYGAYVSEREKHERLELLYQSSRILQHSPELDSALGRAARPRPRHVQGGGRRGRSPGPRRRRGAPDDLPPRRAAR